MALIGNLSAPAALHTLPMQSSPEDDTPLYANRGAFHVLRLLELKEMKN